MSICVTLERFKNMKTHKKYVQTKVFLKGQANHDNSSTKLRWITFIYRNKVAVYAAKIWRINTMPERWMRVKSILIVHRLLYCIATQLKIHHDWSVISAKVVLKMIQKKNVRAFFCKLFLFSSWSSKHKLSSDLHTCISLTFSLFHLNWQSVWSSVF